MRIVNCLISSAAVLACVATLASGQERAAPYYQKGETGLTMPRATRQVNPSYTREALDAKVQGIIDLEAVVLADGSVGDVTIKTSVDDKYGLDQEAVQAMKQWQFDPGRKDGKPVPVLVDVRMTFTLR